MRESYTTTPEELPVETVTPANSTELGATLRYEAYTDDDGIERQIYTLYSKGGQPVKVVFYSPEEIPSNKKVVGGKHVMVLGEKPKYRPQREWQRFNDRLFYDAESSNQSHLGGLQKERVFDSGNGMIFVESNPTALLDLAAHLGAESDKHFQTKRQSAHLKIITPEVQTMIDKIIATKIQSYKTDDGAKVNYQGELLTVLSLLEDKDAQAILDDNYQRVLEADDQAERQAQEEIRKFGEENQDAEELKVEDLIAVHSTKFLPRHHVLQTTFDATGWKVPRNTIHCSLNHPVSGHAYGSWDSAPYVVLSPLSDMIRENGNPARLNTVDTYFEPAPGTDLKLPKTTWIVRPGNVPGGEVITIDEEEHTVRYKTENIGASELNKLCKGMDSYQLSRFSGYIARGLSSLFRESDDIKGAIVLAKDQLSRVYRVPLSNENTQMVLDKFLTLENKKAVQEACRELYDIELNDEELIRLSDLINNLIKSKIKEHAVNSQIERMGFVTHRGGMWAWDRDSWEATNSTVKLGATMGVPVGPHNGTINSSLGQYVPEQFIGLNPKNNVNFWGEELPVQSPADIKNEVRSEIMSHVDKISPELRRVMYLMGAI